MAIEYFGFLGILSSHERGLALLKHSHFWDLLAAVVSLPQRGDLALLLIHSLAYTGVGGGLGGGEVSIDAAARHADARSLLRRCCEDVPTADVRQLAVQYVSVLATRHADGMGLWALDRLRNAAFDESVRVRAEGLRGLLRASDQPELLARLVSMHVDGLLTFELILRDALPVEQQEQQLFGRSGASVSVSCSSAPNATPSATPCDMSNPSGGSAQPSPPSPSCGIASCTRRTSTRGAPSSAAAAVAAAAADTATSEASVAAAAPAPAPGPTALVPSRASPLQLEEEEVLPWAMSLGYMLILKLATQAEGLEALTRSGWLQHELPQWRARNATCHTDSGTAVAFGSGGAASSFPGGGKCEAFTLGTEGSLAEALQAADVQPDAPTWGLSAGARSGASPLQLRTGFIHASAAEESQSPPPVPLPPHLFGALASTPKGRAILLDSAVLETHIALLEADHTSDGAGGDGAGGDGAGGDCGGGRMGVEGTGAHDAKVGGKHQRARAASGGSTVARRAALWAVGYAGSTEGGFEWLVTKVRPHITTLIDQMARSSPCLSLRGTAIAVLGLLGGSGPLACARLAGRGWTCPGVPGSCVALPASGTSFLGVGNMRPAARAADTAVHPPPSSAAPAAAAPDAAATAAEPATAEEAAGALRESGGSSAGDGVSGDDVAAAIRALCDMCCSASPGAQRKAMLKVQAMREAQPQLFKSRELFLAAHSLLGQYKLPLAARRQIHALVSGAAARFEAPDARANLLLDQVEDGPGATGARRPSLRDGASVVSGGLNPEARKSLRL